MLDTTTTLIMAGSVCALLPLLLWWLAPPEDPTTGSGWWQLGSLTAAAGLILLGLRGWLPLWMHMHVANTALLVALMLWTQSLWTALGRGWTGQRMAWACVLALAYYSTVYALLDISIRLPLNRCVMGLMALYIAHLAWRLARLERSHNAMALMTSFGVLGLGLLLSAWLALDIRVNFLPQGAMQNIPASPAVLAMVTAIMSNFCYLGLLLEQAVRKKERAMRELAISDENARMDKQLQGIDRQERLVLAAGSLAHELNQPLSAALMRVELARDMAGSTPVPMAELTGVLEKASASLERTGSLLDRIWQATQSKQPVFSRLDLRKVVVTSCELTSTELEQLGVLLQADTGAQVLPCQGDEVQLSQVLENLLRNAAQALQHSADKRITIRAGRDGDALTVSIEDTGPGVPEEVLTRWGQPFNGHREGGMGLGLSICLAIVQQHGGQLQLRNLPQGGAQASIRLPAAQEAAS